MEGTGRAARHARETPAHPRTWGSVAEDATRASSYPWAGARTGGGPLRPRTRPAQPLGEDYNGAMSKTPPASGIAPSSPAGQDKGSPRGAPDGVEAEVDAARDNPDPRQGRRATAQADGGLTRFDAAFIGREARMIELKNEVNARALRRAEAPTYSLGFAQEANGG